MVRTLPMAWKELEEGRRLGIPEGIIGKMGQGIEPTEQEKEIIKRLGKVYVLGHAKYRGKIRVKPQLRDLPGGRRQSIRSIPKEEVITENDIEEQRGKVSKFRRLWEKSYLTHDDDKIENARKKYRKELDNLYILRERKKIYNIKDKYSFSKAGIIRASTEDMLNHRSFDRVLDKLKDEGIDIEKKDFEVTPDPRSGYDNAFFVGVKNGNYINIVEDGPGAFGVAYDYYLGISKKKLSTDEFIDMYSSFRGDGD